MSRKPPPQFETPCQRVVEVDKATLRIIGPPDPQTVQLVLQQWLRRLLRAAGTHISLTLLLSHRPERFAAYVGNLPLSKRLSAIAEPVPPQGVRNIVVTGNVSRLPSTLHSACLYQRARYRRWSFASTEKLADEIPVFLDSQNVFKHFP
jgi:hypothetical protein